EEQIVWPDRANTIALLTVPCRITLSRVDNRTSQIKGEGSCLSTVGADAAQSHGGIRCDRRAIRINGGDARRAAESIAIGCAVVLEGLADDADAGTCRGINLQVGVHTGQSSVTQGE